MKTKKIKIVDNGKNISVRCKGFEGNEDKINVEQLEEILRVTILNFLHKGISMEETKIVLEQIIKEYKGK